MIPRGIKNIPFTIRIQFSLQNYQYTSEFAKFSLNKQKLEF